MTLGEGVYSADVGGVLAFAQEVDTMDMLTGDQRLVCTPKKPPSQMHMLIFEC